MIKEILETLWFFLPILVANQCPGFAVRLNMPGANVPVSSKWLGEHKTWAAYYAGPFGALCTLLIQYQLILIAPSMFGLFKYRTNLCFAGLFLGLGAILGDHIKSFFKRRLGKSPGTAWWPFDQLDFVIGGIIFAIPVVGWIGWERTLIICSFVLIIHPIGNRIGYKLGLREVPW
jgi:CDP-2,3-bis-(O-geranylgeranyl)-sn-glycerol synthase